MNDLISRQAAIDVINALHEKPNAWLDYAVDAVMTLPTIDAIPIEWILLYIQEYPYMTVSSMLHYWSLDQALERKEGKKNE